MLRLPHNAVRVEVKDGMQVFIDANGTITHQEPVSNPRTYRCFKCQNRCRQICYAMPMDFCGKDPEWEDDTDLGKEP